MARLPFVTSKADLPEDKQYLFDRMVEMPTDITHLGPFTILLYSPEVAVRAAHLRIYLFAESNLTPVDRHLAMLLAVRESDCEYIWSRVVGWALEVGARQEAIDVIGHRRPLDSLTPEEAVIVAYGQELLRDHRVSDATFEAARARYSNPYLTDLTATLGFYTFLACVANAFEIEAPPGLPRLP